MLTTSHQSDIIKEPTSSLSIDRMHTTYEKEYNNVNGKLKSIHPYIDA
jgi:hypothetical protein